MFSALPPKADFPILTNSRRQLFANAAIAASRVGYDAFASGARKG